jgi:hypothetical protein
LVAGSYEDFKSIPFPGEMHASTTKSFCELVNYRDLSVGELLEKGVADYLSRVSINNVANLRALLKRIKLNPDAVLSRDDARLRERYSRIAWMIDRRHRIVHEADFASLKDTEPQPVTPSDVASLFHGMIEVDMLVDDILKEVNPTLERKEQQILECWMSEYRLISNEASIFFAKLAEMHAFVDLVQYFRQNVDIASSLLAQRAPQR